MTDLNRGDVILVWFPNSDLKTFKRRPALVVQADDLATILIDAVALKLGCLADLAEVNQALRVTLGL